MTAANNEGRPSAETEAQSGIRAAFAVMERSNSANRILDADQIASSFEQAPYESRVGFRVYGERIDAANGAMHLWANRATQFSGDNQDRFQHAMDDVRSTHMQLETSLQAAENATRESWIEARANLARDYRNYADAVARAQSVASS
jgi:hypothetical protein